VWVALERVSATKMNEISTDLNVLYPYTTGGDLSYRSPSGDYLSRLAKPSSSGLLLNSSSGTPSYRDVKTTVQLQVVATATEVDSTSGVGYFYVPTPLNGMNLVRATAFVDTAGTTNATTIQVRNLTKYASNDALSSAISIASGATSATAGSVNTSYDDVSTDDKIKIYVTGYSTTRAKGLWVVLEFQLP
jgi:hypothetical protein